MRLSLPLNSRAGLKTIIQSFSSAFAKQKELDWVSGDREAIAGGGAAWSKQMKPPGLPDRPLNVQEAPWYEQYLGLQPKSKIKSLPNSDE